MELNRFERQYTVIGKDGQGYYVDLGNGTCQCKCFDIDRYPCVHAQAAIIARGEMSEDYCSKYYYMEQWTLAYYKTIYPVPHHSLWESYEIPDEILSQVVYPPHVERKKGRLQETRFPSAGEYRRKKKTTRNLFMCCRTYLCNVLFLSGTTGTIGKTSLNLTFMFLCCYTGTTSKTKNKLYWNN